jgi:hypothetical protein
MVIADEVTGFPLTHIRSEVNWQVMISPFTGVNSKVVLFVPTFAPFLFH